MSVPIIQSIGPPPALHADRVTAEMLKYITATHFTLWRNIRSTFRNGSLGNTTGQQRLVRRLEAIGGAFLPVCHLKPGKRCHFTITLLEIAPWDQNRDAVITEDDPVPVKPSDLEGPGPRQVRYRFQDTAGRHTSCALQAVSTRETRGRRRI
jgi:hypothetical protein